MNSRSLPTWEEIDAQYLRAGIPGEFVMREEPRAIVSVSADKNFIGASFEVDSSELLIDNPLSGVELRAITQNGRLYYRLAVNERLIFRPFYHFAIDLVYSINSINAALVANSISAALATWAKLFEQRSPISEERQLGLYGELYILRMLVKALGYAAVQSWTGPSKESHDFRLSRVEFEVKTTHRDRRLHEIHGLNQLQASKGFELFLISLRAVVAGSGGESLSDLVQENRDMVKGNPKALNDYEAKLVMAGYLEEDAALYSNRLKLADDAQISIVDESFPRMTPESIMDLNRGFGLQRLIIMSYVIDATGLGKVLDKAVIKELSEK